MNLSVVTAAAGDECSTAFQVSAGSHPFSNVGASTSFPWPCAAGGADIWFEYLAPGSGNVDLDLCGSGYDCCI